MGLPRAVRLRRSRDVRAVLDGGRRVGARLAALYWRARGGPGVRVAVIAGRSVGKAVRRNRARRLLREAVRRILPRIREGHDLVWIARTSLPDAAFAEVQDTVLRLLRQAGLLREEGSWGRPKGSSSD